MTDDYSRDRLRRVVREFEATHAERAWGWRFLVYGLLAVLIGLALAACHGTGLTAPAVDTDCSYTQTVIHGDSTFRFTAWYPETSAVCLAERGARP